MRKNNKGNDNGLLIWGIIFLMSGFGSGIGVILILIYILKKVFSSHDVGDLIKDNIEKKLSENNNSKNRSSAKVIYAEKVETVNSTPKEVKIETQKKDSNPKEEYTSQQILEKLTYYNSKKDMSNDEIIEKISTLNKMLISIEPKIDKIELKENIKEINKTIDKILRALKNKKSKIKDINHFTTYYLPVTLKILIKYDEIENLKLNSENSIEFMNTVEEKIKMIKEAFKKQLENLYIDDLDDVEAELNVLETMLKAEGYTDIDDFNLGKKTN